jgi:hypothetical protein
MFNFVVDFSVVVNFGSREIVVCSNSLLRDNWNP